MARRGDGSILPSALRGGQNRRAVEQDFGTYRCMVVKLHFIDDETNLTFKNAQVTYDAIILSGRKEGQTIVNAKLCGELGGQYNFEEKVLRATSKPFSGESAVALADHDGDIVYITFVNGNTSTPIIIGFGTQQLDEDNTGATRAEGARHVKQFNGVKTEIDKNGKYTKQVKSGTYDEEGAFLLPDEDAKYEETIDKELRTRKYKSGLEITEDGENDKVTFKLASGTLIDVDGAGGITFEADGATKIVINKEGDIDLVSGTKVNIKAPLVDVGEGAAFSSTLFENLLSEFAKHTHTIPGSAVAGPFPVTGVTGIPAAPLIKLVGSQSVKVKD